MNLPLRGREFVTRKITDSVARIRVGKMDTMELGNFDAVRDWGYAEYVRGLRLMLSNSAADTFVLATGTGPTARDFVSAAFRAAGMILEWRGSGFDEHAVETGTGTLRVRVDPRHFRPAEVSTLRGNAQRAKAILGWEAKTGMEDLARLMVKADLERHVQGRVFQRKCEVRVNFAQFLQIGCSGIVEIDFDPIF